MGLAHIGKVIEINSIEGADRIESLTVIVGSAGKWRGTAQKGQFGVGSLCAVFLQDALLPQVPEYSFMEKNHWRVKMMRFKGVPSEVLIMPLTLNGEVGDDITDVLGVTKYSKPIPESMAGQVYGDFPSFIPKTDEPNYQTVPEMVEALAGHLFYSTVKADGSSATIYKYQGHFGCCSRNLELKETEGNAIWKIARKYHLEEDMPDGLAFQMEIVGPGIQGNPMGLKQIEPRVFNAYSIDRHEYHSAESLFNGAKWYKLPTVDVVDWDEIFDISDLQKYAEGLYPNGRQREGVVFRPMTEQRVGYSRLSFKTINLLYKD